MRLPIALLCAAAPITALVWTSQPALSQPAATPTPKRAHEASVEPRTSPARVRVSRAPERPAVAPRHGPGRA